MEQYTGDAIAAKPSRVLVIPEAHFADMLYEIPVLGQRLVGIMSDRVRDSTRNAQQREKMMSLGTLAAGLAHELNNPAAAVRRTTESLRERLTQLPQLAAKLADLGVTEGQVCRVNDVREQTLGRSVVLSTMQRSEREDAVMDWLDDHDVADSWMLAETLVDAGLTEDDLEAIAASVPPEALLDVLAWFESSVAADRLLAEITDASSRISELVTSVKSYTHMDRDPNKQAVDVRPGINSTLTMLGHKLRKKSVDVECDFAAELPPLQGYPGELNQVWTNLIDNAIDAMPDEGAQLRIEVWPQTNHLCIRITDNGHGIPEELQSRIFDPFFSTKEVGSGTGLGLDIVQRIVREHHHGDINVTSASGATTFEIILPVDAPQNA
jgi:signal transduction histidine kinase